MALSHSFRPAVQRLACIGLIGLIGLAGAAISTPSADAAVPRGFWGMNATGVLYRTDAPAHFAAIRAMGVDWLRVDAHWHALEPSAPVGGTHSYRWSTFDTTVRQAAEAGLTVRAMAGYSPAWASVDGTKFGAPKDPGQYAAFVKALALRYGPYGDFWQSPACTSADCRVRGAAPIEHVEVWNEPNLSFFWHQPDPVGYGAVLRATIDAVRSEPRLAALKVGVGGLLTDAATPSKIEAGDFLRRMVAAEPSLVGSLDEVNVHAYHHDTSGVIAHVSAVRTGADSAGLAGIPLVVNENGWTTSASSTFSMRPETEEVRAVKFQYVVGRINQQRIALNVTGYAPYTWLTRELDPANGEDWFGIGNHDATPKPSAIALRDSFAAIGYEEPPPTTEPPPPNDKPKRDKGSPGKSSP